MDRLSFALSYQRHAASRCCLCAPSQHFILLNILHRHWCLLWGSSLHWPTTNSWHLSKTQKAIFLATKLRVSFLASFLFSVSIVYASSSCMPSSLVRSILSRSSMSGGRVCTLSIPRIKFRSRSGFFNLILLFFVLIVHPSLTLRLVLRTFFFYLCT